MAKSTQKSSRRKKTGASAKSKPSAAAKRKPSAAAKSSARPAARKAAAKRKPVARPKAAKAAAKPRQRVERAAAAKPKMSKTATRSAKGSGVRGSDSRQLEAATDSARRDRFVAAAPAPLKLPVKLSTRVPIRPASFRARA